MQKNGVRSKGNDTSNMSFEFNGRVKVSNAITIICPVYGENTIGKYNVKIVFYLGPLYHEVFSNIPNFNCICRTELLPRNVALQGPNRMMLQHSIALPVYSPDIAAPVFTSSSFYWTTFEEPRWDLTFKPPNFFRCRIKNCLIVGRQ